MSFWAEWLQWPTSAETVSKIPCSEFASAGFILVKVHKLDVCSKKMSTTSSRTALWGDSSLPKLGNTQGGVGEAT